MLQESLWWGALAAGAAVGLASVPHCALMCGPVSAAVCQRRGGAPALRYQVGRIVGYGFLGLLAGQLGAALTSAVPESARWVFRGVVVACCGWIAWRLWRPRGSPLVASEALVRDRRVGSVRARFAAILPREPIVLGTLSALLPCGALYAAVLLAAAAPTTGAAVVLMVAFALTTSVPLLAAATALHARVLAPGRATARWISVLLVAGAALMLLGPLADASHALRAPSAAAPSHSCH